MLSHYADLPVLDLTKLDGTYHIALEIPMQDILAIGAAGPPGDGLFRAVQKLGLKLERHRAPVDTIVVDHLEKTATSN
jgi:uncharacterized protein (TIGR03435 family)